MRRLAYGTLAVLIGLFAIGHWVVPAITATHWYKIHVHDDTYFYRMKVALSHKGVPIDFDVVVGCGVRVTSDHYSGASIDILGWYPFVYAKEIPGGHAVMIRTTVDGSADLLGDGPCRGATSTDGNGRTDKGPGVAADWLPIVVWYEHADDLSHGLAYVTQDAYASPASQLEFHGARIEHAKRVDFDRFMETAPPNLVPAYNATVLAPLNAPYIQRAADVPPAMVANPRSAWRLTSVPTCRGVERFRLDENQRAKVRALWPADRPRFWSVPKSEQIVLGEDLFGRPDSYMYQDLFRYSEPDTPQRQALRPEVFPFIMGFGLARLDKDTDRGGYPLDVEIGDSLSQRGMMACDVEAPLALEEAVTGRAPKGSDHWNQVFCRIDGTTLPVADDGCRNGGGQAQWVAFENDEFIILGTQPHLIGL